MKSIMAITKLQRFARVREHHTILSKEIIKPYSQIPPHLKTHNLSAVDHFAPNIHMPWVFFYPNYSSNNGDINILKKSLSQCLTQYYPFAGKFLAPSASQINCNDAGVEFLEAFINNRLDDFIIKKEQDETLDQLFPNALGCSVNKKSLNMMEVQLNHFTCGGAAVAVSISHKVGDAFTMVNFFNDWATITRGGCESLINPTFISSSLSNIEVPEFPTPPIGKVKYLIKRFVFPNSNLNKLIKKVNIVGTPSTPTRVETLTSFLFRCAVAATTSKSGYLSQTVNLRNRIHASFPKLAAGNLAMLVTKKMNVDSFSGKIELNQAITNMRKVMMEIQGLKDVEEVSKKMANTVLTLADDQSRSYNFSSVCRFPFYDVDFGWGKPVQVLLKHGNVDANIFILMDTPARDGIEVTVQLEEQDMRNFQKDKEVLAYAQDI